MARVENRPVIQLACTECKQRNDTTRKNKKNYRNPTGVQQVLPAPAATYAPSRSEVALYVRAGV